jgi:hypothetical protein
LLSQQVLRAEIADVLGIINIVNITDITNIATGIADIVIDIAVIADQVLQTL